MASPSFICGCRCRERIPPAPGVFAHGFQCSNEAMHFRSSPAAKEGIMKARLWAAPRGGDSRDRTGDLLLARQALSQLSYIPIISIFF